MGPTLYCIIAVHDPARAEVTREKLRKFLASLLNWKNIKVIYVANTDEAYNVVANEPAAIRTATSFREFSAWQDALEHIPMWSEDDAFLFLNDVAFINRIFSGLLRWRFQRAIDAAIASKVPVLIGEFMNGNARLGVKGLAIPRWVSTYLFLLNGRALSLLDGRLFYPDLYATTGDIAANRLTIPNASKGLSDFLQTYLLRPGVRSWYKAAPLSHDNLGEICIKASATLNEMIISAMALARGVECIDIFNGNILLRRLRTAQHFLVERWFLEMHARKK